MCVCAPVIALDNTAFPEFAGGVARLLPDARIDTLANGIYDLLYDPLEQQRMAQAGPLRAADYDWRIVSQSYIDLLTNLAAKVPGNANSRV